jgi:hypothetical protein
MRLPKSAGSIESSPGIAEQRQFNGEDRGKALVVSALLVPIAGTC